MPLTPQSVATVNDLVSRMLALIALRNQATLFISDNPDAVLTTEQAAVIKAALLTKFQALRDGVKNEVSAW